MKNIFKKLTPTNKVLLLVIFSFILIGAGQWFRTLSVGGSSVDSSSVFDVISTTKGARPVPSMTETQRNAISSPATGLLVYNTTTNTVNQYNGTGWVEVGSGAGGGSKNYISDENSLFEQGTADWETFNDSTDYVDGTGGTSGLTISVTSDSNEVLEDSQSLEIVKPASDTQFEGVSVLTTTIDRSDQGKVLFANISGDFSNVTTSGDWELRAYDVTNSEILYTGTVEARSIDNVKGLVSVPVYLGADTASVRLSLHCNTTDTAAYSIFIDEVKLGPSVISLTSRLEDWTPYTPDFIGATNGTAFTNTTSAGRYKRIGDAIHIYITTTFSGAPGGGTGLFLWKLPDGLTIDTTKLSSTTAGDTVFGASTLIDSGTLQYAGNVVYTNGQGGGILVQHDQGVNFSSATVPYTFASGDEIHFEAIIPITEWANSNLTLTENQLGLQTVKARYTSTTTAAIPNTATIFDFNTQSFDTHNAVTTGASWAFTAPRTGYYSVTSVINFTSGASPSRYDITIRKNGSTHKTAFLTPNTSVVDTSQIASLVFLEKGDTLDIRHNETVNGGSYTNSHEITIEEIPDFTLYGAVSAPRKIQNKFLTADITTDTTMSDLTFSNLVVGQWYKLKTKISSEVGTTPDNATVTITHNSQTLDVLVFGDASTTNTIGNTNFSVVEFKAEASTLTFASASIGATTTILGNSTKTESWAELSETEPKEVYSGW